MGPRRPPGARAAVDRAARQKLHKTTLVALAYRAAEDPLGEIRGMIEDRIVELLEEAAEGATQMAFCDTESACQRP